MKGNSNRVVLNFSEISFVSRSSTFSCLGFEILNETATQMNETSWRQNESENLES